MIERVTESKQPLPRGVVHLKPRAIRCSLRTTVTRQPAIIRLRERVMKPIMRLAKWKIWHYCGTTAEKTHAALTNSLRWYIAIAPRHSLGAVTIFPAAR